MYQRKETPEEDAYTEHLLRQHRRYCVLKAIITFIIVLGVAVVIFLFAIRPAKLKFHVVTANLAQFDITNRSILHYNLSLNMTDSNPNKKVSIYYDRLEAMAYYEGLRFGNASLSPFYQGRKNSTDLSIQFRGQQAIQLVGTGISKFNQEKNDGFFNIEVKFKTRIRFKMGGLKTMHLKPKVDCQLKVPLASKGSFTSTGCDMDL